MNITQTTPASTTSNLNPIFHVGYFRYLTPCNLILAVYILIQNSMIIYNYCKDWKRLSSLLFILIAATDIASACSELGRGCIALFCMVDKSMSMPKPRWMLDAWFSLGFLCYTISTYFAMVLTVVKTINIIKPLYNVRERALMICLAIFPSLGLMMNVADIWDMSEFYTNWGDHHCRNGLWISFHSQALIGTATLRFLVPRVCKLLKMCLTPVQIYNSKLIADLVVISFEFGLPCLIVFFCMIVQMIYIKRAFSQSADQQNNKANHINITVFLISLLYILSASVYAFVMYREVYYFLKYGVFLEVYGVQVVTMLSKYTLHLLNAALFPTILILRKRDLRAKYKGYISAFLRLPVSLFNKLRLKRGGYTEI